MGICTVQEMLVTLYEVTGKGLLNDEGNISRQMSPPSAMTGQEVVVEIDRIDKEIVRRVAILTEAREELVELLTGNQEKGNGYHKK